MEERDVDLLLMEEFHVSPGFVAWFAARAGVVGDVAFDGAWHSVNGQDGETDLLLRVRVGGERVALLIENKVAAPEQEEQDLRYHLRGARARDTGLYDRYATVICAPLSYLGGLPADTAYEYRVAYESIAGWYAGQEGPRARWRGAVMLEAVDQGRRGYVMQVHAGKTAFHSAYHAHLVANHPWFVMAPPGPKGPRSDWMIFKGLDFPRGVKLVHKNDQGCVDLEFERTLPAALAAFRGPGWPDGARILKRGGSAAISLPVPACDMGQPFAGQVGRVDAALAAAGMLAPLAGLASKLRQPVLPVEAPG